MDDQTSEKPVNHSLGKSLGGQKTILPRPEAVAEIKNMQAEEEKASQVAPVTQPIDSTVDQTTTANTAPVSSQQPFYQTLPSQSGTPPTRATSTAIGAPEKLGIFDIYQRVSSLLWS